MNAGVSLDEVYRWTGVRVDVFVNVLAGAEREELQDGGGTGGVDAEGGAAKGDTDVRMVQVGAWEERVNRVVGAQTADVQAAGELADERVQAAYLVRWIQSSRG